MLHADNFRDVIIFLVAAGIVVPLFHRARLSTVLGFLLLGIVLGPAGLGRFAADQPWLTYVTFADVGRASPLGELGIIFLLFLLGLELSLHRLWQLRRYVLGIGALQMICTGLAVGALVTRWGLPPAIGLLLGATFALSSTAIVMQVLAEQHRTASITGRVALSVLLFQDLMVVPVLFAVHTLAGAEKVTLAAVAIAFAKAIGAIAAIMAIGRYVARPLLRAAARTGSRDLIMANTLLILVAVATATGLAGLSAALGAFLAGLLLSESEYRHQIEVDLEPFKGLLLGVFFLTVGTGIDVVAIAADLGIILVALVALLLVKTIVLLLVARAFGVGWATAAEVALLLAQAGEFAFVVVGIAGRGELFPPRIAAIAIGVVGLSMLATPLLARLARRTAKRLERVDRPAHVPGADADALRDHVVIGGFGRVGQTVAQLLEAENVPFVALDGDAELVDEQRKRGRRVYFGDAARAELLERAGAAQARAFVVTVDTRGPAERMVLSILSLRPDACILARAKDADHAARLAELGAFGVIPEAVEASLQLGGRLLEALGIPDDVVEQRLDAARAAELEKLPARET